MQRGLFRYDVTACETKVRSFYLQTKVAIDFKLNLKRLLK